MEILNQLGELFLAAVPTVVIVFLFYFFMRWSFFKPMERVLSERYKRAEGARQEAEASRTAVQEKLRSYNETLRKARGEMFTQQEAERRLVLDRRQTSINTARTEAQKALQEEKKAIADEIKEVRSELEQSSGDLANEIAEALMAGQSSGPSSTHLGGAR